MTNQNFLLLPPVIDQWQELSLFWDLTLNWSPTPAQNLLLAELYQLILAGNQLLNLTRITEPLAFWEKHLWDSLRGLKLLLPNANENVSKIIDIGTGCGFPGIPVAIAFPQANITLLDATQKKIAFLDTLLTSLGVQNAHTLTGRAEEINHQLSHHQIYQIALVRAVATAPICAEYALPFLDHDGLAIFYRGQWTIEEEKDLQKVLQKLGGAIELIDSFTTPISQSVRNCIYVRKH